VLIAIVQNDVTITLLLHWYLDIFIHVHSAGRLESEQNRTETLPFRDEFDDVFSALLVETADNEEQRMPSTTARPLCIVLSATGKSTNST
jgi:hypothetical protein